VNPPGYPADVDVEGGAGARRGRPLDLERTPAILDAAIDCVRELGLKGVRVQDVADRAGVGLATIYRRWPTKHALLVEALDSAMARDAVEPTGDARADLVETFTRIAQDLTSGPMALECLAVMNSEPDLAEAFRRTSFPAKRERIRQLIAAELGDGHPELDVRADVGPAVCMYRALVTGDLDDPQGLAEELADVVLGLRT
jgi:AcrR family transcriptional regulator